MRYGAQAKEMNENKVASSVSRRGRKFDPIEAQSLQAQRESFERSERTHIIRMADDMERDRESDGFKHLFFILNSWLEYKEGQYKALIEAPVRDILEAGKDEYLMSRIALEAEINQLKAVLNIPTAYKERAKQILNPPSSETYRRKTKVAKGE